LASAHKTVAEAEERAKKLKAMEDVRLRKQEEMNEKKAKRIVKAQETADKKRRKIEETEYKKTFSKEELKLYNKGKANEKLEAAQKLLEDNEEPGSTSDSDIGL